MKVISIMFSVFLCVSLIGCSAARRSTINTSPIIQDPTSENALISFIRGGQKEAVMLWNYREIIGFSVPHSILQYEVAPGKHDIMALTGRKSTFKKINVEQGGHYIIVLRTSRAGHTDMIPVGSSTYSRERVENWFKEYDYVRITPEKKKRYEDKFVSITVGHYARHKKQQENIDKPLEQYSL